MWPFSKKEEPKENRTQACIDKLQEFRKVGETFNYLGRTCVVTGHSDFYPYLGIVPMLKGIQEKTAFLPDYGFKPAGNKPKKEKAAPAWPGIEAGTSAAGIIGAAIVLGLILLIGVGIRTYRGRGM